LLLASALGEGAVPGDPLLEDRLARIERIMENQSASGLMLQMQQLQQEMQELRGLVETQQFEIQKLQRQQRDQYLDIDSRLSGGPGSGDQEGAAEAAGAAPPSQPGGAIDGSGQDLKPPVGSEEPAPVTAPTPSSPGAVGIPSLPTPETTGGNERDGYRDAFDLLKQRQYPQAVAAFNELLRIYPQGQYTDNARYWLAETHYVQRNYPAALAEFDRLVRLHPASTKIPGALLKIGYIQYEQEAYDQARAALQEVVTKYPDSTEARLARSRLERIGRERR
jgi:tol-pal system protein YbgF